MDVTDYILSAATVFSVNESKRVRAQGASILITLLHLVTATGLTNTNTSIIIIYY